MEFILAKLLEEMSFEDILKVLQVFKQTDNDAFKLLNEIAKDI